MFSDNGIRVCVYVRRNTLPGGRRRAPLASGFPKTGPNRPCPIAFLSSRTAAIQGGIYETHNTEGIYRAHRQLRHCRSYMSPSLKINFLTLPYDPPIMWARTNDYECQMFFF